MLLFKQIFYLKLYFIHVNIFYFALKITIFKIYNEQCITY